MGSRSTVAFTLLELLVVIVIIAILAVLLSASVMDAKRSAEASQCVSNIRQLAVANLAYAGEHDGVFVLAQEENNRVRWHGVRTSSKDPFDPSKGPLAPYLGGDGKVKLCPSFRDALKDETFEEGTGGYGYNATYVGGTPRDPYQAERVSNLRRSSQTVMFSDTAFARKGGLQEYAYCEPYRWVDDRGRLKGTLSASVHFRHHDKANVAWCDGHVSAEPYSTLDHGNVYGGDAQKWKIGWFGPQQQNGYWNPQPELVTDP